MTVDTEKMFGSLIHSFLLACLVMISSWFYKMGQNTTRKPRIFVSSMHELRRHTSILKKVCSKVIQFLCIFLCLEVLFILVKANPKIWGMNIFQYANLYTAYENKKIRTILGNSWKLFLLLFLNILV